MKKILLWVGIVFCLYVVFIGYIAFRQDSYIFLPRSTTDERWKKMIESLHGDYVSIMADDGNVLEGGFLSDHSGQPRPTVIFFPGNGMLVEEIAYEFADLPSQGINVLLMDYRGYGLSTGEPDVEWIKRDAEKIFDAAASHVLVQKDRITVIGFSLGTGFAAYLASVKPAVPRTDPERSEGSGAGVANVILLAPFTNMVDRGMEIFHIVPRPIMRRLLHASLDTLSLAPTIHQPALIAHGEADEAISSKHAIKIRDAWAGPTELLLLPGVGHQDILESKEMWQKAVELITTGTE